MYFELNVVKETENNTWSQEIHSHYSAHNKEMRQRERERVYDTKET